MTFDADADGVTTAISLVERIVTTSSVPYRPNATEIYYNGVDNNCDGHSDFDADRDGFDSVQYGGTDCNDVQASISPACRRNLV